MKQAVALISLLCLLAPALGCDKVSPVAPAGSTLSISASPASIPSPSGTSTITIVARQANGNPLNPGTEIRLDTNLGTIDPVVRTDQSGVAQAILRGDGRLGKATVRASTGIGEAVTTEVQIGEAAKSIVLQPTPTTVPEAGGTIQLLALVRDASGRPLPNQGVNFTTDVGRLNSRGAIVQTNANGQARDTLTVSEADLAGNVSAVSVSAQTAGSDGALVTSSFSVQVQGGRPIASFAFDQGSTDREVLFTDTSTGGVGDLTYSWDFGDNTSSNDPNPNHTYAAAGSYTVRLTISDDSGQSDTATARITVPVTTPGTGQ
jgi:hypothetical protein